MFYIGCVCFSRRFMEPDHAHCAFVWASSLIASSLIMDPSTLPEKWVHNGSNMATKVIFSDLVTVTIMHSKKSL